MPGEQTMRSEIVNGDNNTTVFAGNVDLSQVQKTLGTNWTHTNAKTIVDWMYMGAYQMKILDLAIAEGRSYIRRNAVVGIVLSTLTGTLSVSTFSVNDPMRIYSTTMSAVFALFSFTVAICAGYIKIYQIQERLEDFIKNRQDWISFTSVITSELQLPEHLRRDALYIIIKYKDKYLDLIKSDIDIPYKIRLAVDAIMRDKQTMDTNLKTYTTLADFVYAIQVGVLDNIRPDIRVETESVATTPETPGTPGKPNIREISGRRVSFEETTIN